MGTFVLGEGVDIMARIVFINQDSYYIAIKTPDIGIRFAEVFLNYTFLLFSLRNIN